MTYWEKILNQFLRKSSQKKTYLSNTQTPQANPHQDKEKCKSIYFLGKNFPGIYLTQREAECMSSFLKDKTVVEAASLLNLSPRTVEFYLKNMKIKLECKTKSELIHKVRESDFLNRYLHSDSTEKKRKDGLSEIRPEKQSAGSSDHQSMEPK